jgi:hypothetical protein
MFVRWQEYKSRAKSRRLRAFRKKHGQHRLRAMLVETVRIDGKPHQRYLAYLGSVQADRRDRPRFWYDVTRKLDQCRLSREERNRIKSAIAKKIGGKVPTKAALKKFERRRAKPARQRGRSRRAQQTGRMRRVGVLMGVADDTEGQARVKALQQVL